MIFYRQYFNKPEENSSEDENAVNDTFTEETIEPDQTSEKV